MDNNNKRKRLTTLLLLLVDILLINLAALAAISCVSSLKADLPVRWASSIPCASAPSRRP